MKNTAYKLTFTYIDPESKVTEIVKEKVVLATCEKAALRKAEAIVEANREVGCVFHGCQLIPTGRIWKVTMDGIAHHKQFVHEDMHKVIFVDALDMYDAEQIAYSLWERQVVEEGWEDISIWRTFVEVPQEKKEAA